MFSHTIYSDTLNNIYPAALYTYFFLGANSSGLGIKMLVFSDEELANNVKGTPLLVSELGSFVEGEVLKGHGVRLVDYQQFTEFEEDVFY